MACSVCKNSVKIGTRRPDLISSISRKLGASASPWPCTAANRSALSLLACKFPSTATDCSPSGPAHDETVGGNAPHDQARVRHRHVAHGEIEPLLHQIDHSIGHRQIDGDLGI